MINCPRCGLPNVTSNKFDDEQIERANHIAQTVGSLGVRRFTVVAGLGALAFRGVNALLKDWRCPDCHHKFDDGDVGLIHRG